MAKIRSISARCTSGEVIADRCTRKVWLTWSSTTSGWIATSGAAWVVRFSTSVLMSAPGKSVTSAENSSARSIWVQWPQWLNTCRSALGSRPSIVTDTDNGTTLSSRPCTSSAGVVIARTSSSVMPSSDPLWRGSKNIAR